MSGSPIYQVSQDISLHVSKTDSKYSSIATDFKEHKKARKRGFFASLFCCGSDSDEVERPLPRVDYASSISAAPRERGLLPPLRPSEAGRKCLVLDLDETLVHSSFKPVPNPDFVIQVEIDNIPYQVFVKKRPGVDQFMKRVGEIFEVVIFTASLSKYADPVLDLLDRSRSVHHRLFREHCANHLGNYVKDLSKIGRELNQIAIIDNSPASYLFQPQNAVPITSWFDDTSDTELIDLIPFLEELAKCDNVYTLLDFRRQYFSQTM